MTITTCSPRHCYPLAGAPAGGDCALNRRSAGYGAASGKCGSSTDLPQTRLGAVMEADQSNVTAAVQDCCGGPSCLPVNGSKCSPSSPWAAIWLSESLQISCAPAESPSRLSDCHSSQLMTGRPGRASSCPARTPAQRGTCSAAGATAAAGGRRSLQSRDAAAGQRAGQCQQFERTAARNPRTFAAGCPPRRGHRNRRTDLPGCQSG